MRKETDEFSLYLRRIGQVETSLRRHSLPDAIVTDFLKACMPTTPRTVQEKAVLLEPLADYLLKRAKNLNAKSGHQVRFEGGLPLSVAGAAAMEIVGALEGRLDLLPVTLELLAELLNVKAYRARESRSPEARNAALRIFALQPNIGINELAALVDVSPSTISRWRKDPVFNDDLRMISDLAVDPRWRSIVEDSLRYEFLSDEELHFYQNE